MQTKDRKQFIWFIWFESFFKREGYIRLQKVSKGYKVPFKRQILHVLIKHVPIFDAEFDFPSIAFLGRI